MNHLPFYQSKRSLSLLFSFKSKFASPSTFQVFIPLHRSMVVGRSVTVSALPSEIAPMFDETKTACLSSLLTLGQYLECDGVCGFAFRRTLARHSMPPNSTQFPGDDGFWCRDLSAAVVLVSQQCSSFANQSFFPASMFHICSIKVQICRHMPS